ncbi:flippase [Fibrella arboris]|uniref:flippase n=1 Tax=Fibrella arboris TaxID=3242486 RepID=UPI003522C549
MLGKETALIADDEPVAAPTTGFSKSVLKRFAVNVASLFSVQVANFLLPLLTVPYVVRIIGPERLGLLNFSLAYVTYFSLIINYGFDLAAVRAIAANRYDRVATSRIVSEVMAGKTLLWGLSTIIFAGITFWTPSFREHWLLHVCTYITCISTVLSPFWIYQAMEDLGRVAMFNLLVKILFTGAIFLVIHQPDDYVWQNLVLSVSQVLINAVALGVAAKRFGIHFFWPSLTQLVARFRADATLFFSNVMITLYASSTVFFLGMLSTAYAVGLYSAGTRLEGVALTFVTMALNQALFPIIANAFGQSREAGLKMVRTVFWPLLGGLGAVAVGLWVIAPWFIPFFFGEKFVEAIAVLRVVALLPLIIGMSNLLGIHTMLNLRMDRPFFVITAIGSAIGLGLNIFLIREYGHLGAAWAWVGTEVYVLLAMGGYLLVKSKGWTTGAALELEHH